MATDHSHITPRDIRARLRGQRKTWTLITVALVLAAWAGDWLYYRFTHLRIDDARIDGEVITISSRVSGWVTELPVMEGRRSEERAAPRPGG